MQGIWWKLPGLRRASAFQRGFAGAVGFIFGGSTALFALDGSITASLAPAILSDTGQIGATLLVAFAVESSWLVKQSRQRGSGSENWIGFVAGLGASGALGIAFAVALLGHDHGAFNGMEHWAATWAVFSVGLLAGLVGALPYALYEWRHALSTEYPDE